MPLAILTGRFALNSPKTNHNKVPKANSEYMDKDIPEVSFVLMVWRAWGKNDNVVQQAAARPITVIRFVLIILTR